MLTRRAIRDMDGRDIKPVISLVLERLLNPPATAKAYCEDWRERQDARSELIRSEDKGESVISYRSYESAGVKHRVVIEYLVRGDVGLQAICDSTESVYDSVSDDFTSWVESVRIDPQ